MLNYRVFKNEWPYFKFERLKLLSKYERWQKVAIILKVSKEAEHRLKWIIYYYEKSNLNVSKTARHFGISRKTFYIWFNQFNEDDLYTIHLLEDQSKAPRHVRQREITKVEEERIIKLRKKHIRYGKMKIVRLYKTEFKKKISAWKIQKVIEIYKLYYQPVKTAQISQKRAKTRRQGAKKKTIDLMSKLPSYKKTSGYIICLDTVTIYWNGLKRYIFTAIDKFGKVAYARMYKSKSSFNGQDFLYRLYYLLDGNIPRVGHDNGTEFEKYFKQACLKLNIQQYYSRVRTPKDNPDNERFNQTLQQEFINLGNFNSDPEIFNRLLTEWLIEYNFRRPHQTLNYETPINASKVLPMYSSWTQY